MIEAIPFLVWCLAVYGFAALCCELYLTASGD